MGSRPPLTVAVTVWDFDGGASVLRNSAIKSGTCCLRIAGSVLNQFSPWGGRMEKSPKSMRWRGLVTGTSCGPPAQPATPIATPSRVTQTRTIRIALPDDDDKMRLGRPNAHAHRARDCDLRPRCDASRASGGACG